VGLIAFAGGAFLQAPLTIDYTAVVGALQELDTEIIPRGGTNIAGAIAAAVDAFGKGESDHRALIIFTDGEELDADGVKAAAEQNGSVRIFTVGLGSPEGSLIPIAGAGGSSDFVRDQGGNIVKSRLDEDRLRAIAEASGGFYLHLQNGRPEMKQLVENGLGTMTEKDIDARVSRQPIERYQWPLSAGLVLLAASWLLSERKRIRQAAAPLALLALLFPRSADARNTGLAAYERHDYKAAQEEFSRQLQRRPDSEALQYNLGSAAYKAGEFDKAMEAFGKALTTTDPQLRARAEYNLGNTLFQRGAAKKEKAPKLQEWKNALERYEEALKIDPKDANAEYNRNLVRHLIEQLEQQPPPPEEQQKQDQQKKEDQQKQEKGHQQDQQQQGDSDQQKQDQQKQDQQSGSGDQQQEQSESEQSSAKNEQEEKEKAGEKGEKKEEGDKPENKPAEGDKQEKENGAGDKAPEPEPEPGDGEKKEGELKSADATPPGQSEELSEEAAEAMAAANGEMTETQARNLLESLKGEDDKVQLLNPRERKNPRQVLRDW
jgi:Ca-activated chloride channel family protein